MTNWTTTAGWTSHFQENDRMWLSHVAQLLLLLSTHFFFFFFLQKGGGFQFFFPSPSVTKLSYRVLLVWANFPTPPLFRNMSHIYPRPSFQNVYLPLYLHAHLFKQDQKNKGVKYIYQPRRPSLKYTHALSLSLKHTHTHVCVCDNCIRPHHRGLARWTGNGEITHSTHSKKKRISVSWV